MTEPFSLSELKRLFAERTPVLTAHASARAIERKIRAHEIVEAVVEGAVIEDYPNDKYGPSCLVLGYTASGRPLHIQVSYPPSAKVITVYEPSIADWEEDWKTRR